MKNITTHTAKFFKKEDVLSASLAYFHNDELAATTWINKYAVRNSDGTFAEQTPNDMHRRMAQEFARIEARYQDAEHPNESLSTYGQQRNKLNEEAIFDLFNEFRYVIPQGSVMAALGNDRMIASLSNCVVIPPTYDSYGGILLTDQQMAQLFKRRCGVGVDLSDLRPKNQTVSNAAGTTTGAVSFMERFSNTTREVAQNGRRGALMLTMDIAHPDVADFITIKQDLKKVTGANISVRLSDEFMQAVQNDTTYTHRWPIDAAAPSMTRTVRARDLWETIIRCAHNTAEPGLIFWDRQHYYSPSSVYPQYRNSSTNPCSEIAMQGGDSCRLIALNLYSFVRDPFTPQAQFDFDLFYQVTYEAQRLMDDLVDLELEAIDRILAKIDSDPEPDEIKHTERSTWSLLQKAGREGRRTGLGFTALADALAALQLRFDSAEAQPIIEQLMQTKLRGEFDSSVDMAILRGSFAGFDPAIEQTSEFVQMLAQEFPSLYERMMQHGRRNVSISTVAPTGTLSMLAQTSSGIEPVFLLSYRRRRKLSNEADRAKATFIDELGDAWEEFDVYHPKLKTWMEITGQTSTQQSPYAGSTAPEIDWLQRVSVQALVQKYTTHSISSTINLPSDVSVEQVGDIYLESWKQGLKGITVYRDGSRSGVLIANDSDKKEEKQPTTEATESEQPLQLAIQETLAPKRPKKLEAEIIRFSNDYEKWLAVIGLLDGRPYEIFTGRMEDAFNLPLWVEKGWVIKNRNKDGKSRYDFQYLDRDGYRITIEGLSRSFNKEFWNYAKLLSGILRHGMPLSDLVELVNNLNLYDESINTWKNGVARSLKRYIPNGASVKNDVCPECKAHALVYEEGCQQCKNCGYSKCG